MGDKCDFFFPPMHQLPLVDEVLFAVLIVEKVLSQLFVKMGLHFFSIISQMGIYLAEGQEGRNDIPRDLMKH